MSKARIVVNDPAYSWLPDEKSVVIHDGDKGSHRVSIHPWARWRPTQYGELSHTDREVSIVVGELTKAGDAKFDETDERYDYGIVIVDRDDFVEGLLAVFPELTRA